MAALSEEDIDNLIISDFDARIAASASEISSGTQFSVVSSLPGISDAASSTKSAINEALLKILKFTTGSEVYPADLRDWAFIEDGLDSIFSRVDESLASDSQAPARKSLNGSTEISVNQAADKPQRGWADLVDNERAFFVPIIRDKLHAVEPLDPELIKYQTHRGDLGLLGGKRDFGNVYEREIRECLRRVVKEVQEGSESFLRDEIAGFEDLASTELVFVDTEAALDKMVSEVIACGEVALDLEHHDVHSYHGFTALIQLSTREKDFIVDPFPLFHSLHKLNRFTADPRIKKTLHGADMDVQWLQRDFGVYLVNMFDSGQAARVLGLAGGYGFANLLDTFCKIKTNKKFQMADWRVRPLPKDMLEYARMDTHYLLYIRDRLEQLLLSLGGAGSVYGKKMLIQVMEKSFGVASKVYRDPSSDFEPDAALQMCLKSPSSKVGSLRSNRNGLEVLGAVLRWRERKAKILDESKHFVLPNAACFRLAHAQPLTVPQVLRCVVQETSTMFPSLRIGTQEADEILFEIRTGTISQSELPAVVEPNTPVDQDRSRRSSGASVVKMGGQFGLLLQRKESLEKKEEKFREKPLAETQGSKFFQFLTRNSADRMQTEHSEAHKKVAAEIIAQFTDCPESLKSEYASFVNQQDVVAGFVLPVESVAFSTDFVSFSNKKAPVQEILGPEGLPLTLREQRKRAPETVASPGSAGKKQKKAQTTSSSVSAAQKALEFVEAELSLAKPPRR